MTQATTQGSSRRLLSLAQVKPQTHPALLGRGCTVQQVQLASACASVHITMHQVTADETWNSKACCSFSMLSSQQYKPHQTFAEVGSLHRQWRWRQHALL